MCEFINYADGQWIEHPLLVPHGGQWTSSRSVASITGGGRFGTVSFNYNPFQTAIRGIFNLILLFEVATLNKTFPLLYRIPPPPPQSWRAQRKMCSINIFASIIVFTLCKHNYNTFYCSFQ